jgi:hypothetical protein
MTSNSSSVRRSLQDLVIPILRQRGYRGTWRVMSRCRADGTQFVVFELRSRGAEVRIGLATADMGAVGSTVRQHAVLPNVEKTYLLPTRAKDDDAWFGPTDAGADRVATAVLDALIQQGGAWWAKPGARVDR